MKHHIRCAVLGIACLFVSVVHAQMRSILFPDAPKPTLTENFLYAGDAAARSFDVYTTREMLKNPYVSEFILPSYVVHHTPLLSATDGVLDFAVFRVSRLLDEHHHHKLAIIVPLLDMVGVGCMDIHNNYISGEKPPVHYTEPPQYIGPG